MRIFLGAKVAALAGMLLCASVAQGVTIGVAPATVVETEADIEITVGAFGGTTAVRLQNFADLNGNGAVESGEPLVHQISLKDGQSMVIGGVRNVNVSGDEDGLTNGVIRTVVRLAQFPELGRLAGKYVLRATAGDGSSAEQSFTITQATTAQQISGAITSGGAAVPFAAVVLMDASHEDGAPVGGTVSDATGHYVLNVAPGTYALLAAKNGFVYRFDTAPVVEVSAGVSEVANLTLEAASRTISGVVGGPAGTFVVPGIQIFADSEEEGAFAIGLTGENGQFVIPVVEGSWVVEVAERQRASLGYIASGDEVVVSTIVGNAENVRLELTPVNALIHGILKTAQNVPLPGIFVYGSNGSSESYGSTDAEGRFVIGVTPGQWGISAERDQLQALNYFVSGQNAQVAADQAVLVNLVATELTASISGRLVDETGTAVSGVTLVIQPVPFQGGGNNSIYPVTSADGSFEASLYGGTWNIALECGDAQERGFVSSFTNVVVPQTGSLSNVIIRVPRATVQITGTVKDSAANPIANLQIDANALINGASYHAGCLTTDAQGAFTINVVPGNWMVNLRTDELEARGFAAMPGRNIVVGGGANVVNFIVQSAAGPIQLSNPRRLANGRLEFQVSGRTGDTYVVEGSTTMSQGSWGTITTVVAATPTVTITADEPVQTVRFYRIRKQ